MSLAIKCYYTNFLTAYKSGNNYGIDILKSQQMKEISDIR
jgi:hypothetical protein